MELIPIAFVNELTDAGLEVFERSFVCVHSSDYTLKDLKLKNPRTAMGVVRFFKLERLHDGRG